MCGCIHIQIKNMSIHNKKNVKKLDDEYVQWCSKGKVEYILEANQNGSQSGTRI